jgi:hypothetical protein
MNSRFVVLPLRAALVAAFFLSLDVAAQPPPAGPAAAPAAGRGGPGGGGGRGGALPFDPADHTGYEQIFDGKTLDGWDYAPEVWHVEDGMIVGGYNPAVTPGTTFIIYKKAEPIDFDLIADVKSEPPGNTGIQFRSKLNDLTIGQPNAAQQAALSAMDAAVAPQVAALAAARLALSTAVFATVPNAADIGAKAQALGAAEQALALGRAAEFERIQTSSNRLSVQQVTAVRTQIGRGGNAAVQNQGGAFSNRNVAGYQADYPSFGQIFDGGRKPNERGIVTRGGEMMLLRETPPGGALNSNNRVFGALSTAEANFKPGEFNQYHLMVRGYTFFLFMNGKLVSVTVDDDTTQRVEKGIIALQIEGGKQSFKNIWLKTLR